jgi:urease accessory protein
MEDGTRLSRLIRLLQLASPALPIGSYSYSTGLETAIDVGRVRDADNAFAWIADAVSLVLARFDAPLLAAAVRAAVDGDRMRLAHLNRLALAARETAELRLECEQAGYSLGRWIAEVAGPLGDELDAMQARPGDPLPEDDPPRAAAIANLAADIGRPLASPVGWGLACASVGLPARDAVTAFLWSFAENQAAVLLKAMPLGQAGAQRLLLRLGPVVAAAVDAVLALPPSSWSNAAPGLAIASMRHETQYSRLFRS